VLQFNNKQGDKLMHNLKSNFDRIKPIVKESLFKFIDSDGNIKKVGTKPNLNYSPQRTSQWDLYEAEIYKYYGFTSYWHPKNILR